MMNNSPISIAIDGPSGAGKSTLARRCAEAFGFPDVLVGNNFGSFLLGGSDCPVRLLHCGLALFQLGTCLFYRYYLALLLVGQSRQTGTKLVELRHSHFLINNLAVAPFFLFKSPDMILFQHSLALHYQIFRLTDRPFRTPQCILGRIFPKTTHS